jgi:hypothetical protein
MLFFDWAMIASEGISFNGAFYTCPEAITYQWFENARTYGERELLVLCNEVNTENIYCTINGGTKWILCRRIVHEDVHDSELNAYYEKMQMLKQQRQGIVEDYSVEEANNHRRTYQGS